MPKRCATILNLCGSDCRHIQRNGSSPPSQKDRYLEYFEETYRLWFVLGMESGSEENLRLVLETMTLDYNDIMRQAEDEAIQKIYEANTEEARQLGVFGAPSFSVGSEIFWGDDRLEDTIRFATNQ